MSDTVAARWEEYNEAGRRSFGLGQFAEAEELFRAAVREGEQLGHDSPHLATSLNALGQIRLQAKDLAEAERCFTRALSIREQTYGPDSHAIVASLNNLSALHDAKGETDRAIELLRRSLTISEEALGASHPEVALALSNLAKLYFKRRDFSKADRLLLRLLDAKRALGRDHPEVATVLGSLAKLRQAVGKHGPAEQLWRQALAIRERAFAPNDQILANTIESVADCCAAQEGRLADAITLRERALVIRETAMGAAHPSVIGARARLAELRARPGAPVPAAEPPVQPSRSSQELPSPLLSHEVPPFPAATPSAPTPDLPWIQVDSESTGERPPARLELMSMEPPMLRPPAPEREAPAISGPLVPPPLAPPPMPAHAPRASSELVFSDSLAPETARPAAPPPPRPPASRPAPPPPAPRTRTPPSGTATYRAPTRDRVSAPTRQRRSKAPALFFVLVVAGVAGGWYALNGKTAVAAALLEPVLSTQERPRRLPPVIRTEPIEVLKVDSSRTSGGSDSSRTMHVSPVPSSRSQLERDSAARARALDESPEDAELNAPTISSVVAIDSVTLGIERSTKSKLDSAQKPRIDIRTPIFRKP